MKSLKELAIDVAELVEKKNKAYGDSFGKSGECLRQMYPNGIKPDQYDDLLTITRILDKLFRIANNPKAFEENPYRDINGYSLKGIERYEDKDVPLTCILCGYNPCACDEVISINYEDNKY